MVRISRALRQALFSCGDGQILILLFVPFILSLMIAAGLFFTLGLVWVDSVSGMIEHSLAAQYLNEHWQIAGTIRSVSYFITLVLILLLTLPVAYLISVMIVSVALMPILLKILQKKHFSHLVKKHGGTLHGNIWNTLKASSVYLALFVVTLPLWLVPGLAVMIPILLGAYLNKRIFVYDVLEEYASKEERLHIEGLHRKSLYGLGAILGVLNYIPLTFVVMPVFAGLAYSYFCLNALQELRETSPT